MRFVLLVVAALVLLLVVALSWRAIDWLRDKAAWRQLGGAVEPEANRFDPAMVADLPEAARHYFTYSILPGARLSTVAEIDMEGELGLGDQANPGYRPMRARQILAPPHGLVWRLNAGLISGSDGALPDTSWTRFWLFQLVPVVRVSGNSDHHRSAFGRVAAEAAFWTPAALLPSAGVVWDAVGPDTARARLDSHGYFHWIEITVGDDGAPVAVKIDRWSNENPERVFRLQPFGGTLTDFREFDGFRVPTRVEGGNHFGTNEYFPFFKSRVTAMRFM